MAGVQTRAQVEHVVSLSHPTRTLVLTCSGRQPRRDDVKLLAAAAAAGGWRPAHAPILLQSQPVTLGPLRPSPLAGVRAPGRREVPPPRVLRQAALLRGLRGHQRRQRGARPGRVRVRVWVPAGRGSVGAGARGCATSARLARRPARARRGRALAVRVSAAGRGVVARRECGCTCAGAWWPAVGACGRGGRPLLPCQRPQYAGRVHGDVCGAFARVSLAAAAPRAAVHSGPAASGARACTPGHAEALPGVIDTHAHSADSACAHSTRRQLHADSGGPYGSHVACCLGRRRGAAGATCERRPRQRAAQAAQREQRGGRRRERGGAAPAALGRRHVRVAVVAPQPWQQERPHRGVPARMQ